MKTDEKLTAAAANLYLLSIGYQVEISEQDAVHLNRHAKTLEAVIARVTGSLAIGDIEKAMEELWQACPDKTWADIAGDNETLPQMKQMMTDVARREPGVPILKKSNRETEPQR